MPRTVVQRAGGSVLSSGCGVLVSHELSRAVPQDTPGHYDCVGSDTAVHSGVLAQPQLFNTASGVRVDLELRVC